jgi:hypothetical protein
MNFSREPYMRNDLLMCCVCLPLLASALPSWAEEPAPKAKTPELRPLSEGIASFGAVADGGYLYVYGGHTGETHKHSTKNLSAAFQRISLDKGGEWESLPSGPGLQGLQLVADRGVIYRVGGMLARNEPGQPDDLHSVDEFCRYDSEAKKWIGLAPLPEGRSSHGAVVLDGKLYVVGGWCLKGSEKPRWLSSLLMMDLRADKPEWKNLGETPFSRRALAAVAYQGKVWVFGGLLSTEGISSDVDIYNPAKKEWSKGSKIPGMPFNGNGIAACVAGKNLCLSPMDGKAYFLADDGKEWRVAGKVDPGRIHHRLIPLRDDLVLAVAGATMKGHLRSSDLVPLEPQNAPR